MIRCCFSFMPAGNRCGKGAVVVFGVLRNRSGGEYASPPIFARCEEHAPERIEERKDLKVLTSEEMEVWNLHQE